MRRESSFAFSLFALIAAAGPAAAQGLEYWGSVRGWDVMVDPSLGYGCLIQAEYQDGLLVRIGWDANEQQGYVTVVNSDWGEIESGAWYEVDFELDREQYTGEARGFYLGGVPGVDIMFDNDNFFEDIARRYSMTVYNGGYEVMSFDLDGTYAGLEEVVTCQQAQ